jgi:transmembrane sensor
MSNIDLLISKIITDNASHEEQIALQNWLAESSDNQKHFESQKLIWDLVESNKIVPAVDVNAAWNKFNSLKEEPKIIPIRSFLIYKIAAVFIVLLASTLLLFLFVENESGKQFAAKKKVEQKQAIELQNKIEVAENTQETNYVDLARFRKKKDSVKTHEVYLPDSSIAKLAEKSEIKLINFNPNQTRIASLSGAGMFDIKPQEKDFVLETEELKLIVQGTKFNIESATEDNKFVVITVEEGFMQVFEKENPDNKISISSNQKYVYDIVNHRFSEIKTENKRRKLFKNIFKSRD